MNFNPSLGSLLAHIKGLRHPNRPDADRQESHVTRDWLIMLLAGVILCIGISMYSFLIFISIQQESGTAGGTASENVTIATFNRPQLKDTLTRMEERSAVFDGYRSTPPALPDPSQL